MKKELQAPPAHYEVGKFYDVLCVYAKWPNMDARPRWWPVLGPQHEDSDFINAGYQHYHVDFRFLNDASRELLRGPQGPSRAFSVVVTSVNIVAESAGLPTRDSSAERMLEDDSWFQVRRVKCKAQWPAYPSRFAWWLSELEAAYMGERLRGGRYCPHKGTDLSTIKPDGDVVTCPLHGLRWNVRTGELVSTNHGRDNGSCGSGILNSDKEG